MHMDAVWRSLAKDDCKNSIENIYHTVKEFPDLTAFDDEFSKVKEHLEHLCFDVTLQDSQSNLNLH